MASPLRFRYAPGSWSPQRVHEEIYTALDANLGAASTRPDVDPPPGYDARRFDMDNGDIALFAWDDDAGYWVGNTETPSSLWRTDKIDFADAPYPLTRWVQRVLLEELHEKAPWLEPYAYVSWFFLPVFLSKDGRETTLRFFRDDAAGFPDASRDEALAFYESFLKTGVFDDYREEMAGKLGTSTRYERDRMAATMGEFDTARILVDAGYDVTPEIEVKTGHSLDFRASRPDESGSTLVEVTRPQPPTRRAASSPVVAVSETAESKANGQLDAHGGGVVLFVDCSSFPDDAWAAVRGERPSLAHRPAVVFRARPDGRIEGYRLGSVPLDLDDAVDWVE